MRAISPSQKKQRKFCISRDRTMIIYVLSSGKTVYISPKCKHMVLAGHISSSQDLMPGNTWQYRPRSRKLQAIRGRTIHFHRIPIHLRLLLTQSLPARIIIWPFSKDCSSLSLSFASIVPAENSPVCYYSIVPKCHASGLPFPADCDVIGAVHVVAEEVEHVEVL